MTMDDFLVLLNTNATAVAELFGVSKQAVYWWRKNGIPPYWFGKIIKITDSQVEEVVKKINNQKLANAQKWSRK